MAIQIKIPNSTVLMGIVRKKDGAQHLTDIDGSTFSISDALERFQDKAVRITIQEQ